VQKGTVEWVFAQRLATQQLTTDPAPNASDVVQRLGCVQAQERDQAHCHSYGAQSGVCPGVQAGLASVPRRVARLWRRAAVSPSGMESCS